jgi:Tfp pilus assembly protein PilE
MTSIIDSLRRRSRQLRTRDAGLTIIEMMVTLLLMGIVGTIMFATVVSVTQTLNHSQANSDSLDIARVGMNRLAKTVRSGMSIQQNGSSDLPPLAAMAPNQLTVYASLGTVPAKVTYSIDANRQLIESWYAGVAASSPYWTFSATPRTEVIARQIPATAPALFTFLDVNGAPVANQTSSNSADLSLVHGVSITLTIDSDPSKGGGPVTLVNTVSMPNQGIAKR